MLTIGNDPEEAAGLLTFRSALECCLDVLFTRHCIICSERIRERGRKILCSGCESRIALIDEKICRLCGRPAENTTAGMCSDCLRKGRGFDMARSLVVYCEPVRSLICAFKYGCMVQIGDYLAGLMACLLDRLPPQFARADVLTPVPLHPLRWVQRGFNQAEVLGARIGRELGISLSKTSLYRQKDTDRQVGLSGEERRRNMKGAFAVNRAENVKGRSVLLVDDVITTGSTLEACAAVLKKAGATHVYAITLAAAAGPSS